MTRREPCCVRWCAALTLAGSVLWVLLGWLSYDGDEGT